MNQRRVLPALILATPALTGCEVYVAPHYDDHALPGGIYDGSVGLDGDFSSAHLVGVVTDSGEARYVDSVGRAYVAYVPPDTWFDGSMTLFDGADRATGPFSGYLEQDYILDGDFSVYSSRTGFWRDGSITSDNDALLYQTPADLHDLAGVWSSDNGSVVFTIETDGWVFGQDASGCTYAGEVFPADLDTSVYRMEAEFSCGDTVEIWRGLVSPTLAFTQYALFLSISAGESVLAAVLFD